MDWLLTGAYHAALMRRPNRLHGLTEFATSGVRATRDSSRRSRPDLRKCVLKERTRQSSTIWCEADWHAAGLCDGSIDLGTGVVDATTSPELRQVPLFADRMVGVVRTGHRLPKGVLPLPINESDRRSGVG